MEPVQPSAPDLPVSSSDFLRCPAEPNSVQVDLQSAPAPVTSVPECPLPSASPPLTRAAQRRRRLDEQPIASKERTTKATSVAGVASVSSSRKRKRLTGAQLAKMRRANEAAAAASQNSNNNDEPAEVEGDEGDLTDVDADLEETTAMAMKDRVVQCRHLCLHGTWIARLPCCHRLASAIARILRLTSGRCLQRLSVDRRMTLSDGATGARSASMCFHIHPPTHPCPLESDPWPGKGNMAEKTMRGLQAQRQCSALTFSGTWPIHPQVFQVVRALLTRSS